MVKNLFGMISIGLLLIGLSVMVTGSRVPVPSCSSPKFVLNDLPITLDQTQTYNMNDVFSGYNLNFNALVKPEFVTLRSKLARTKVTFKNQSGLKNYHLGHQGNTWGSTLVTISVFENKTTVRWGVSHSADEVPDVSSEAVVSTDPSMQCYDSVWWRNQEIILIDCAQNSTFGLQNYFLYLNSTSKALIGKVKNDMYVPFNVIVHRKIRAYQEDGYYYLIRAYFADHVDDHYDDNTYVEILSINNIMKPWTIRVMDRSFLHQSKLSVMDFEVYLGDIYILDYHSGVIKFDITTSQTIVISGRYRTDSGFTKLGVYSNNLDNEVLLVLAHGHAIIEVDWSNQIKPEIVTKYSIPENAQINDLWVNEQYVVTQLTANLTDSKNQTVAYQSTYVFTRGSRTYLNAYVAIPHPNFHAFVDFNRDTSQLMAINTDTISIYQIAQPILSIKPRNPSLQNTAFNISIKAESKNEYTNQTMNCTFNYKFLVVPKDSLVPWPTGLRLPDTYYANYPGKLFIPLDRYVIGSNITYGVVDEDDKDPPVSYILQQNETLITWKGKKPSLFKYSFLRQEQFDSLEDTILYIYTQDYNNVTYFTKCTTIEYTEQVMCQDGGYASHLDKKINNLTATRFHYYGGMYVHLAALLLDEFPNQVFIHDVETDIKLAARPIMFPTGFEGKIQNVEFLGHYLVVVLRYVKEIVFFDMIQCLDHQEQECSELYRIDSIMMAKIGVEYFSPIQVYTSDYHPFVLFIQCLDRVVIVDITRNGPILLTQVKSPASSEPGFYKWKMAIARGELVLVNPPDIIEEHDLDELYSLGSAPVTKEFPIFGYKIPDKFDLDFSDNGNLVYITAIDPKLPARQSTVILVYKTGLPAVASLYDVFHLYQNYDDVLIDATGVFGDYVAVAFGSILTMFRQYEIPILVFEDSFVDYSFNLTYTNDPDQKHSFPFKSQVRIANYPQDIIVNNSKLNSSDYLTNQFDYVNNNKKMNVFDDETWFNGSVINYTLLNCGECGNKIKVVNHVQEERVLLGAPKMQDYAFSFDGGFIQQAQSIIKMRHNGSIDQFVTLPSVLDRQNCISVEHSWTYDYSLSACKNEDEVYLYTTVYTASKPFVNGPYYSSAKHVTSMGILEDLMFIVDVDERPFSFDREGGVIIYAMNHDPSEPEIFDQIEYINTDDLTAAADWPGGPCFIGNAHFSFTNISGTYRLIITQLRNGFFVLDFKWSRGRQSIQILKVEFISLVEEMIRINVPLPNMAFFTAVAVNREQYNSVYSLWQTELIIVTSNFHSFQVNINIDKTGTVTRHEIVKIFFRYGFYESENYIKAFDGYFAIGHRLPTMLEPFGLYSSSVLAVYDTYEHWTFNQTEKQKQEVKYFAGTKIPVEYLKGGITFTKGRITFDWNFTLTRNASDPFRRIGLLGLHDKEARIRQFSVHEKLLIITQDGIDNNQDVVLRARNDYHYLDLKFSLVISTGLPGWAIALIVIGSVAIAAGIGFFAYKKIVAGKRPNRESETTEQSLLEREGLDENRDSDSDSEGEEEQAEQQEEEDKQQGGSQYVPPPADKVEGSTEPSALQPSEPEPAAEAIVEAPKQPEEGKVEQ